MHFTDRNTDEGFYFSLMPAYKDGLVIPTAEEMGLDPRDPDDLVEYNKFVDWYKDSFDYLIPRINLGWNIEKGDFKIYNTASFQMFEENLKVTGRARCYTSWLLATTMDWKKNDFSVRLHGNYGANTGYMGIPGPSSFVEQKKTLVEGAPPKIENSDTYTYGGFLHLGYDLNEKLSFGGGIGYSESTNEAWEASRGDATKTRADYPAQMAFYLNSTIKWQNFKLIPEFGMIFDDYSSKRSSPNHTYFGTQLRMDF
jgi:hypothetical protein